MSVTVVGENSFWSFRVPKNFRKKGDLALFKARGGGVPGSEKNFFSHFVICCSPTHGLSKMDSLSSQLPTVAEI